MKKLINLFAIIACAALFFSCGNLAGNQYQATKTDSARIVLHVSGSATRTVFAPVTGADFTDIRLSCKKTNAAADYETIATYANVAAISTADPVYLVPDTYDFVVSAKAGGYVYKAENVGVTLVRGSNQINAALALESIETPEGTGTFELTFTVPNQTLSKYAEFSLFQDGTAVDDYTNIACTVTDEDNDTVKAVAASSDEGLAAGMYDIAIRFYTDENKFVEVVNLEDSLQIMNGKNTAKAYTRESLYVDADNVVFGTIGESGTNSYVFYNKKLFITGTGELHLTAAEAALVGANAPYFANLEEVYIGDGITLIGDKLFAYAKIKKISGCNDVTTVEDGAFTNCKAFVEINGFNAVTEFPFVFSEMENLETVSGFDAITSFTKDTFSSNSIKHISGFNGVTELPKDAFITTSELETVSGFNSVTVIGQQAFTSKSKLTTVSGFENVTEIKIHAFEHCSALVSIPSFNEVTTMGDSVFRNCTSLKTVNGFNKVTDTEYTFTNCTALESVTGFNSLTVFHSNMFMVDHSGTNALTTINGFNSVTTIYSGSFQYSPALRTVTGFQSVTDFTYNNLDATNNPVFADFYYYGTESDWEAVTFTVGSEKTWLQDKMHFMGRQFPTA